MNLKYEIGFRLKKVLWFLTRPKREGVKCVLENDGKILMVKRTFGTDKYVFPGGAIARNETPEESLRREIKEDLNIELDRVKPLGSFVQSVHHRRETLYCFSSNVDSLDIKFDKNKIQSTHWFKSTELPELTPISKSVISQYAKRDS